MLGRRRSQPSYRSHLALGAFQENRRGLGIPSHTSHEITDDKADQITNGRADQMANGRVDQITYDAVRFPKISSKTMFLQLAQVLFFGQMCVQGFENVRVIRLA